MEAREAAERHGGHVIAGDRQAAMGDLTPEAMQSMMQAGVRPPANPGSYEVIPLEAQAGNEVFDIVYSAPEEKVTIRSHWSQVGGDWKIVKIEKGGTSA